MERLDAVNPRGKERVNRPRVIIRCTKAVRHAVRLFRSILEEEAARKIFTSIYSALTCLSLSLPTSLFHI